jgi:hypothetical protein
MPMIASVPQRLRDSCDVGTLLSSGDTPPLDDRLSRLIGRSKAQRAGVPAPHRRETSIYT